MSLGSKIQFSNSRKCITKCSSDGWDECASLNVNILNNGHTYTFLLRVLNIKEDRSGFVLGFSNSKMFTLLHLNEAVVGLNGDGSTYN